MEVQAVGEGGVAAADAWGGRDWLIAVTDHDGSGVSAPGLPGADEAQGAGPADCLVPAVDAEPAVQACRSLLGCGPGDA